MMMHETEHSLDSCGGHIQVKRVDSGSSAGGTDPMASDGLEKPRNPLHSSRKSTFSTGTIPSRRPKPAKCYVPAKLLMLAATLVSTAVSFVGGLIMYLEVRKLIEDTIDDVSDVDARSIARSLNASYQDVYECSDSYFALLTRWGHRFSSFQEVRDFLEIDQFARINSSENLYSVVVQSPPENLSIADVNTPGYELFYQGVWWDPLTVNVPPRTREWVTSFHLPSFQNDTFDKSLISCSTSPYYCQPAYALDRITGLQDKLVYVWFNTAIFNINEEGPWAAQLADWRENGAKFWRFPAVWISSDGTSYIYATYFRVIPEHLTRGIFKNRKLSVACYFTFGPWEEALKRQGSEATLVATFLDVGLRSQVIATNEASEAASNACQRTSGTGALSPCVLSLWNYSNTIQEAVMEAGRHPEGKFLRVGISGGTHWVRRIVIHPKQQELDNMEATHLVWIRSVATVEDELVRSLVLFVLFVLIVLIFDVTILFFEVMAIARPIELLEKSMEPLDRMDLALVEERIEKSRRFRVGVTEIARLTDSFEVAVAALREYRRFLPMSVLIEEGADEEEHIEPNGSSDPSTGTGYPAAQSTLSEDSDASKNSGNQRSPHSGKRVKESQKKSKRHQKMLLGDFRSRKASLMLASYHVECGAGAGEQGVWARAPVRFVMNVFETVQEHGGLVASTRVVGDKVEVVGSWNALMTYPAHGLRSCQAAVSLAKTHHGVLTVRATYAVTSGPVHVGNLGNETQRVPCIFGGPVMRGSSLVHLADQLGCTIVCDPHVYEQARSSVEARTVDVVQVANGEELPVYELLSCNKAMQDRHNDFVRAFSALRGGECTKSMEILYRVLTEDGYDRQAFRLYKLAHVLSQTQETTITNTDDDSFYFRREQDKWPQIEASADISSFPDPLIHLVTTMPSNNEGEDRRSSQPASNAGSPVGTASEVAGQRRATQCEADMLQNQIQEAYASVESGDSQDVSGNQARAYLPTTFEDARGYEYHRSDKSLGRGAFGEVWLGMGTDGGMVAVKTIALRIGSGSAYVAESESAQAYQSSADDCWTVTTATMAHEESTNTGGLFAAAPSNLANSVDPQAASASRSGTAFTTIAKRQVSELVQEVTLMIALRHENVVSFLGCAVEGGHVLIVMEYLPGGSLQTMLRQFNGRIPTSCVKRYTRDMVTGLRFIHTKRIVHRDLKPANVLLTIEGSCKLADFGASAELKAMSKDTESGETGPVGTPYYMPPEQARGQASTASDMWSLGIIIVELLTGSQPWGDVGNLTAFMARLGADESMKPPIPPAITGEVNRLVAACFQRDPKLRPTARKLLDHPFLLV
eukprot:Hpha_TRINITY_DN15247_c6_g5::TRINITY_DN15247_c6_g5_i7::g.64913::m.64913